MEKIYNKPTVLFGFAILLLLINSCQQRNSITGVWEGLFMDHYRIEIEFTQNGGEYVSGMLRLWDGEQQIQNDELTKIEKNVDMFSFYISAKQTTFIGVIEGDHIEGNFIFPDGSKHKLYVTRRESLGTNDTIDPMNRIYSSDQLLQDLTFTKEKLESLHPNLYQYQDQKTFEERFQKSVELTKDGQEIASFYVTLAPFVSSIGCSHTGSRLPGELLEENKKSGNYFPAKLFFQNGQVFFVESENKSLPLEAGDEILTVNNHYIGEIRDQIFTLIPSEGNNLSTKYHEINRAFDEYYLLLDNNTSFLVSYRNREGTIKAIVLESCSYQISKKQYPEKVNYMEIEFPVTFRLEKQKKTAFLTIPTFGIRDINRYNRYMDSVFIEMNEAGVRALTIDLRGNSGGHPLFAAQLYSYLTNEPFIYFDSTYKVDEFAPLYTALSPNPIHFNGQVFVLTDGACLSTTGHFISLVKYHKRAKIIGQEPGSSYICNDQSRQFQLPATRINLNIPTRVFKTAVEGIDNDSEMLDYPVEYTISDVIEGKDPTMEKATELSVQLK